MKPRNLQGVPSSSEMSPLDTPQKINIDHNFYKSNHTRASFRGVFPLGGCSLQKWSESPLKRGHPPKHQPGFINPGSTLLQRPGRFFQGRPIFFKKQEEAFYMEHRSVFPKNALKKAGILSRKYAHIRWMDEIQRRFETMGSKDEARNRNMKL